MVSYETLVKEHGDNLPEEALNLFQGGLRLFQGDMYEMAAGQFENLLAKMQNHPAAWAVRWNLADSLHYSQRFEEALKQLDLVLKTRPNEAGVWYSRGNTLAGLGRMDESVQSLRQAVELEPANPMIQHHLGMALFDLGQKQEAVLILLNVSKSLEASAKAGCLVRAAAGLLDQGQEAPAQDCLADAWAALKHDDGDEWIRSGMTLAKAGRPEQGKAFLEQGLKLSPCRQASEAAAQILGIKLDSNWSFASLGAPPASYEELETTVADDDGFHLAFLTDKFLAVDEQRIQRDGSPCCNLSLDTRGRWAAAMQVKGKWYGVHEGTPVAGPFDNPPHLLFSSSGKLAVVSENQVYVDGKAGPKFDQIATLEWSPNGERCAYLAIKGKKFHVVVDGKEHRPWEGAASKSFTWSPDSQHFAYAVGEQGQQAVVLDGQPGKWYKGVAGIVFSGDGQHMVHHANKDGKSLVVLDRVEQGLYEKSGDFQLDHTGKTLIFFSGGEGLSYLVVNGQKASEDFADMYNLKVSADGKHTAAFAQRDGTWHLVADGTISRAFHDVGTGTLEWNEGRAQWQCVVQDGVHMRFLEGDRLGRRYDEFARRPPQISKQGKVAYGATRNREWYVVLDGRESEPFERLLVGPGFRGETMHALVVRNGQLERLTV